jgi:signal transduction protein with GAF and PtsI domain
MRYNFNSIFSHHFIWLTIIKNKDIFSIISKVSYVLALSNEPTLLIEMVLDELLGTLNIDCCWAQLVRSEDRSLQLVAYRGFTPEMAREMELMGSGQTLGNHAVMGLKVVIADLSRDGEYGLSSFGKAGLRSLVAVPMRTYHTHGIMGIASRSKKRFNIEVAELLVVIAGLVGASVNSAELSKIALASSEMNIGQFEEVADKTGGIGKLSYDEMGVLLRPPQETVQFVGKEDKEIEGLPREIFEKHARIMAAFGKLHARS